MRVPVPPAADGLTHRLHYLTGRPTVRRTRMWTTQWQGLLWRTIDPYPPRRRPSIQATVHVSMYSGSGADGGADHANLLRCALYSP